MTRQHFEMIAKVLREVNAEYDARPEAEYMAVEPHDVVLNLADRFAGECAEYNDNFDRERFLKACGV